jgi:hypothetical protein
MKTLLLAATSVAAVLTLSLSGCASDDKTTGGSASGGSAASASAKEGDPFSRVVKYAECLQQHGLNVKIKQGDGFSLPKDYDPKVKESAEAACRSVAPPGMFDKPSAEQLDHDLKIAQCLRDQGVKIEDPTENQPQMQIDSPPADLRQLQVACEKKLDASK